MRRERITVAAVSMHSLAGAIARADEQLDAEIAENQPLRIVQAQRRERESVEGAPRPPRPERDEEAQWRDELDVVRKCVANGPPTVRGRDVGGSLGRMIDKRATGTGGIATSTRAYEPSLGSDHYRHAWRCWLSLTGEERTLLGLMFARLEGSADGGADRVARTIRGHAQHGKASEAEAALPSFATALPVEAANGPTLVAIWLGWWREDATKIERWPDAQAVKRATAAARQKLKMALHRVGDLDASGESLHAHEFVLGGRLPEGTRPRLIPRPSAAEVQRDRAKLANHVVCIGLGAIVDGAREECSTDVRLVDTESADICTVCERYRA